MITGQNINLVRILVFFKLREDSELFCQSKRYFNNSFSGGYQDYHDRSPSNEYGGRGQDSFAGFGNDGGFQKSSRKDSDDWGNNWEDSGWSDASPKKESKPSKSSKKSNLKKETKASEGLLIDFDGADKGATSKKNDDWGNDWEDDAWESLNKDD